jgi:two-component system, NtrC family, sensor histidine kinase KinB
VSAGRTARRRSLGRRLRLGFGAIAAAFALLSIAAVASLDRLGDAIATILRENYASVVHCEQMKEALGRQGSAALFAASGRADLAAPMLRDSRASFEDALSREERNITLPGEGEIVREIRARYTTYTRAVDGALALPRGDARAARFHELLPQFEELRGLVQRVLGMNQAHMEDADGRARRLARGTVHGALAVSAAALVFVVWFALWLLRSTTRPLAALTRSAEAIGEGDFAVSVAAPETSELATLASAFNVMTERLRVYRESSLGELLAAKDLARSTLECMLDPVVVLDREGGVLLSNEAAERAFAIRIGSAEELGDAGIAVPGELLEARDRALDSGAPVLPQSLSEAVARRTEAGERHYLVRALPLGSAPREKPRAIVLAQDVTRFRRIDELKSDMVATVSHELKTPLTSLRMATHLLLEPTTGALSEPQRELVTTARDDAERLRAMVEELLDVVRIEAEAGALRRVPVDPAALLAEIADAHATIARDKGVAIEVEPPTDGRIDVDPERISIALSNLVANAIRHTPPGGRVRLCARRDGGAVRLDVEDDGEGVAPELLPRIFDRSFTTRGGDGPGADGPRGHGLGLAIAREIALQHGGELRAESKPGEGSTFSLVLGEG